jgi:hypothetical protein
VEWGLSFLFTCKDESPPWITEQVRWGEAETLVITEWNGRSHLEHRYRWINGIENRAEGGKLRVNYLCILRRITGRRGKWSTKIVG